VPREKTAKAGLKLTDRASMLKGGDSGPAVVANSPNESLLVHAVRYIDEPKMPPKQKLSAVEIAAIERWWHQARLGHHPSVTPDRQVVPSRTHHLKNGGRFNPLRTACLRLSS